MMYSNPRLQVSRTTLVASVVCAVAGGCSAAARPSPPFQPDPTASYVIFDTAAGRYISVDALATELVAADVVLFGEYHDDAMGHEAQLDLFRRVSRGRRGTLGLEMFERDVQPVLDEYMAGRVGEEAMLAGARPWPNYRTDYRPILEMASERGWHVAATNLPQRLATAVAREGLDALRRLDPPERGFGAETVECPDDAYWSRFVEAMFEGADSAANAAAHATENEVLRRTYQAQCARDETMAETISELLGRGPVFHLNGVFHSDFRLGIVPRLGRRAPGATIRVISAVPTEEIADPPIAENLERADYLVFTRKIGSGSR